MIRRLLVILPALLSLLSCRPDAPGGGGMGGGGTESLLATLPLGTLERPVALDGSCGTLTQEVRTGDLRARARYLQGMACLAVFDWVRAARSFHAALGDDPGLGLAYAGLARAYLALEEPATALELAHRGRALASLASSPTTPAYERSWTELAVLQLEAVLAPPGRRDEALGTYRDALGAFGESFPSDPHGLALTGHAVGRADAWGQSGGEAAVPWYRRALEADPDYFPAHHFLAHAFENQGLYEEALKHARRFAELAPGAPHAHHMVAHTAPRRGRWQEALEALEAADALHRRRFEAGEDTPAGDWHYAHNLRLTAAVALHLGQRDRAREAYHRTFEISDRGHRGGFYCAPWIEFLLLEGEEAAALGAAQACLERPSALARVLGHGYRGEALIGLGRTAEARAELASARRALGALLRSLGPVSTEATMAAEAQRSLAILQAKLAVLDGEGDTGEPLLSALGEDLARSRSFDAWASAQGRLRELREWAGRHGSPRLARRLGLSLARLDNAFAHPRLASRPAPPAPCH